MKYKRVISFGDSFTRGDDLHDCTSDKPFTPWEEHTAGASKFTWPALLADNLGIDYQSYAFGGCSNDTILRSILYCLENKLINSDDLLLLNWTWVDRIDFFDNSQDEVYYKKSPDCFWNTLHPMDDSKENHHHYYKNLHSEFYAKFNSLKNISLAQQLLKSYNISYKMTCLDQIIIDSNYWNTTYLNHLLQIVKPELLWFNDKGFYNWAVDNGYPTGKTGHPMEEAHQAAFDYLIKHYDFT